MNQSYIFDHSLIGRYGILALVLAVGMSRLSSAQVNCLLRIPEYTRRKHPLLHLFAQATAVTLLVWLLLGGFHTLYLVYATGWRDFQIVIRCGGASIFVEDIH